MQELNVQPSNPTPYTPAGGTYNNNPVPGAGGLPSLSGLNNRMNPMAQELQNQGRDEDTMLVHMTPDEVNSLQGLAMAHGGSLTINPQTGLPEAGFLKKLLPTLLGAGLMLIPGVNAIAAAGMVGAGSVLKTGSLKKGLMAGLSAYGGASLAGGLGAGNVFGNAAKEAAKKAAVGNFINSPEFAKQLATKYGGQVAGQAAAVGSAVPAGLNLSIPGAVEGAVKVTGNLPGAISQAAGQTAAKTGIPALMQNFGDAAKAGLPGGIIGKAAPMIAASGLMKGVTGAMTPSGGGGGIPGADGRVDNSYQGPYYAQDRQRILDPEGPTSSKQRRHFAVSMPEIYNTMGQVVQPGSNTVRGTQIMQPVLNPNAKKGQPMYDFRPTTYMGGVDPNEEDGGYARGGEVQMSDGAFVLDARTVSELGNGSSNAGMEFLSRMGGRPINGPGDGVSDSIPARIGRDQPARVARDEVLMPADAVRRVGKGSPQRGADKLYALMNKAHKARKKAGRGQDTKLRHGLG
jgi:hypothetical protein